jgi:excisionase family DNA binding protein
MLDEPLWTVQEAAKFLSVSTKTVRAWQYAHGMPFLKIGGTVRFVPADIRRWALKLSVVPSTAVDLAPAARRRPEPRRAFARLASSNAGVNAGRSTALPSQ